MRVTVSFFRKYAGENHKIIRNNLHISKKSSTFAPDKKIMVISEMAITNFFEPMKFVDRTRETAL